MNSVPPPLIVHTEASRGLGGQELRIVGEARWLLAHGWRALLVAQPASPILAEAARAAVPAIGLRMRGAADPVGGWRLRTLLADRGAALVHTHSSVDSWLGAFAGRSLGAPVVRSRHVSIPILRRRALVYRLAHRVIATGEAIAAIVRAAGVPADRVVSVPAGVDTERFHPGVSGASVRAELGARGRRAGGLDGPGGPDALVGLVANVRRSKGHAVFLEAAREVLRTRPTTRFVVVGDGPAMGSVRSAVEALGLEASVTLTGHRQDVPAVMAAIDLLVVPSLRSEGTPQVIGQALAVGTPVVASAVGGIAEVVRDGETGWLVPPGDAPALAQAILGVLGAPAEARRRAEAGRRLALDRFTFDAAMAATTAVYRELLGAGPR